MRKTKKIFALLFAVIMMFNMVLSSVVYAEEDKKEERVSLGERIRQALTDRWEEEEEDSEEDEEEAQREALNQQMAEVQKQIDAKRKELDSAETALQKAKSDTSNAKAQLNAAEQRSAALAGEIALIEEQIGLLNGNIEAVEQAEQEQYELFCQQVRQEEERGSLSYWSVLFKASGFADLLSRIDFINEIMEYDQQVMDGLQQIREELDENRSELETQQADLDAAHVRQQAIAAEYGELYKNYKQTEADLQAAYDEAVAEEAALESAMKEVERMAAELGVTGGSTGGYIWPVKVSPIYITSKFGPRAQPTAGASTLHNGIDIGVSYVPVYAAKAGTVTLAGTNGGFGNCVIISHGTGYSTTYGHLSTIKVKVGDVVTQGQEIAISGNTGTSTGPHLDFRIMEDGVYKDPLTYLSGYTLAC